MVGKACPIPVIEAKKALMEKTPGEEVRVLVDNTAASENLRRLAAKLQCGYRCEEQPGGRYLIVLTAGEGQKAAGAEEGVVVAIGRERMGVGDDTLGGMLMKSFVYSLTELDSPPEAVLLYNGGVHLAVEGAATLGDLQALAAKGTLIGACGACLDFYKLKENLAVGEVTNMYAIAGAMAAAGHLINL